MKPGRRECDGRWWTRSGKIEVGKVRESQVLDPLEERVETNDGLAKWEEQTEEVRAKPGTIGLTNPVEESAADQYENTSEREYFRDRVKVSGR